MKEKFSEPEEQTEEESKTSVNIDDLNLYRRSPLTDKKIEETITSIWNHSLDKDGWKKINLELLETIGMFLDRVQNYYYRTHEENEKKRPVLKDFMKLISVGKLPDNFYVFDAHFKKKFWPLQAKADRVNYIGGDDEMKLINDDPDRSNFVALNHLSMRALNCALSIESNFEECTFKKQLTEADNETIVELLMLLESLLLSSTARALEIAVHVIEYHDDVLRTTIIKKNPDDQKKSELLMQLFSIRSILKSENFETRAIDAIEYELSTQDTGFGNGKILLRPLLQKYNLDPEFILSSWETQSGADSVLTENFKNIRELEAARPSASHYLSDTYGIRNFNRYPVEALIAQYDVHTEFTKPFLLSIGPYLDDNGVFNEQGKLWSNAFNEIKKRNQDICFIEAATKSELVARLKILRASINTPGLITLLIINSHASSEDFILGHQDDHGDEYEVNLSQIVELRRALPSSFFASDAQIILNGCNTASNIDFDGNSTKENLTLKFAKIFKRSATGSSGEDSLKELHFLPDGTVNAIYNYNVPNRYTAEGKKIESQ